jgi:hypothetical protein
MEFDLLGKYILVDGQIVGGNSGGPVILPADFKIWVENGQLKWLNNAQDNFVIGIVSQSGNAGLSVVFSTDYILDLVNAFEKRIISVESNVFQIKAD